MSLLWRKCSSCKNEISLGERYYECSVSTCTSQRTGYVFCSIPCFERHLPGARHKDAAAIENFSPKTAAPEAAAGGGGKRRIVARPTSSGGAPKAGSANDNEILIVASKLKKYIHDRSGGMNTSQSVLNRLSDIVRRESDKAIEKARADGRKTVMDRDF